MARYARGRQHFVFKPRFSNLKISEWSMTDQPEAVENCNILQLSGDIIGLGDTEAVIAGHDWGRRSPGFVHCCGLTSSEPLF